MWQAHRRQAGLLRRAGARRGLALISVLWVLALLALVAASFTKTTRTEINLARNLVENAKAETLADAGVRQAILGLLETDPEKTWRVDGTVYAWRFGGGEIRAAVQDEGGKIDLNRASDELLKRLFLAIEIAGPDGEPVRLDPGEADALVDAIADFRDPDDLRRLSGAEDNDYAAAGLPYGAKDAPFDALEELMQVLGMTAAVYERVAPALTVHSRQRSPHEATAPPLVKAALAGAPGGGAPGQAAAEATAGMRRAAELTETPRALAEGAPLTRSRSQVYAIHAEARLESGAVFARQAVVRVAGGGQQPFRFEAWRQGTRVLFPVEQAAD